jgi:ribosome-associated toxin RatA of RatAB toxin-antitoxin module
MPVFSSSKRVTVELPCDAALAFEILTDYDTYDEWMPEVTESRLLAREGDLAIADFAVAWSKADRIAIECIHDKDRMVLTRTIGGSLPPSKLEWHLAPAGPGRSKLTLEAQPQSAWQWVLPGLRRYLDTGRLIKALLERISVFGGADSPIVPGAERLLQIVQSGDDLMLWYQGKKYKMVPLPEGGHD